MNSLDTSIDAAIGPLADALSRVVFFAVPIAGNEVQLIVVWLIVAALFFTLRYRFVNLWGLGLSLRLILGKDDDGSGSGEVSHFQALCTAISGTIGVGNIAHVPIAISIGGPGAAFWMAVAGFPRHVVQVRRVHARRRLPRRERRWLRAGRTDVLPGTRARRARLAEARQVPGPLLRRRSGDRLHGHRQHVPVEPGLFAGLRRVRRRQRSAQRARLDLRRLSGRCGRRGDRRWHPRHCPRHLGHGPVHGPALPRHRLHRHLRQRGAPARSDRHDGQRRLHGGGASPAASSAP